MKFEIDNVELYFKNKRILNGIYLRAETGTVTGILGSNGCGKSCLLDIIFGNITPKYKLIRIDDTPILKSLYATGRVKYLPQYDLAPNNFKLKSVFKNYEVSWSEFSERFPDFAKYNNYKTKQLSGGERRLVELYITLKSSSELVLLDEPFTHLAPIHIDSVKQLIEQEKKSKAIIITDHYYQHIIEMSDSIYLLKNGCTKLVENLLELEDYKYLSEGSLS